ncbi:3-aminobutyryl-CoA ammonia lyase [Deltaproteobacteria bacterium PRO3]|nr:3-aminobutyryl-CoA ammonia lyase [Deltaproteobacteria bacterium PRO3]
MSPSDAHYAGDLVDGARILGLFGDVATDLLIQSDGEEGLFRAYASVEFLASVRAGDFLEVEGRIVRFGKSSREMRFVARKVIAAERGSDPPGRARVLQRPIVVCRAVGTCVVLGGAKKN